MPMHASIAGEWVGWYSVGAGPRTLRATWTDRDPRSGSIDLFDDLAFRLPLAGAQTEAGCLSFTAPVDDGPLVFRGEIGDGHIAGAVRDGEGEGVFRLDRAVDLPLPLARRYVGTYRLGDGEIVLVGLAADAPDKFLFYARGERLVRLYPFSPDTMFSEAGETVRFLTDQPGPSTGLRWQPLDAAESFAPRAALYAEEDVRFESGEVALAGTLLTPPGDGPHPAVVLMHGTFPGERDFYRVYADRFARRGIAALIYDKRGFGASAGARDSTIAQRAEDGLSALHSLRARPEIDPRRAGLWGFSNATWSLPVAATRSEAVAFLIATGAAGVTMASAETHRRVAELRQWGLAEPTLRAVGRAWSIAFDYAATGRWHDAWDEEWAGLVAHLRADDALRRVPLQDYARADPRLSPIPPLIAAEELRATAGSIAPDFAHDPASDYERVTCPILFLIGERDRNLPAAESAARVASALERAGNRDATVRVLPRVEHTLNLSYPRLRGITTEQASMALHGFRFAPGVLDLMVDWLAERVGLSR